MRAVDFEWDDVEDVWIRRSSVELLCEGCGGLGLGPLKRVGAGSRWEEVEVEAEAEADGLDMMAMSSYIRPWPCWRWVQNYTTILYE